jgi:hypothetical protein
MTQSLIDGKQILFFSDKQRQPLVYQSMIIISCMICLVVGVVSQRIRRAMLLKFNTT